MFLFSLYYLHHAVKIISIMYINHFGFDKNVCQLRIITWNTFLTEHNIVKKNYILRVFGFFGFYEFSICIDQPFISS